MTKLIRLSTLPTGSQETLESLTSARHFDLGAEDAIRWGLKMIEIHPTGEWTGIDEHGTNHPGEWEVGMAAGSIARLRGMIYACREGARYRIFGSAERYPVDVYSTLCNDAHDLLKARK